MLKNYLFILFWILHINVSGQGSKIEILLSDFEINDINIVDTFFSIHDIPKLFKINDKHFEVTKKNTKKYWYEGTSEDNKFDPYFLFSLRIKKHGIHLKDEYIKVESFDDTTTLNRYKICMLKISKTKFLRTIIHFKDSLGHLTTIVLGETTFEELAASNKLKFITKENVKRPEDLQIESKRIFASAVMNQKYNLLFKNYGSKKRQKWIVETIYFNYCL